MQPILAWHFIPSDGMTRFEPKVKVIPGQTLSVDAPLEMCERGLHASTRAIDAIRYAPGPIVCRVELTGEIIHSEDKCCATHRKCLWMADATKTLHQFATDCAERALLRERESGREPHPDSWRAIEVKRGWINKAFDSEELRAAHSAAQSAAQSAAHSAAWHAVWSAVWSAAQSVAESAAWIAGEKGARSTVWSATLNAENDILENMLNQLQPQENT